MKHLITALLCTLFSTLCFAENKVSVIEYCPAPGQFVNTLPIIESEDNVLQKAQQNLERGSMISLGAFGGYMIVKFDTPLANAEGNDFIILGNAFATSAEPGVVMISRDANQNGIADDRWYEIAGSEYARSTKNYEITYYRPTAENNASEEAIEEYIRWSDNQGNSGWLTKNTTHKQPYYPTWIDVDSLTFSGTLLPDNAIDEKGDGSYFKLAPFEWGYADNQPNSDKAGCSFDIDWAVDIEGNKVDIEAIDFIRIHTGTIAADHGQIGEASTEISAIRALHNETIEVREEIIFDINSMIADQNIQFNESDVWDKTLNDSVEYQSFGNGTFSFSHLRSGNSWDGTSWEGFTISRSQDTLLSHEAFYPDHQWGVMAGGGIAGKGTPFILGYFLEYTENSLDRHICEIEFTHANEIEAVGCYVCNSPYTTKCIVDGFMYARKFTHGDYCTLTAHGVNAEGEDCGTVVYYMADYRDEDSTKWILNNNWDWMDLSELGAVKSIYFTMETTDVGDFGANTTFYFGLDQITIRPIKQETSIESLITPNSQLNVYPNPCRDILYIEGTKDGETINIYNLQGQLQLSTPNAQISTFDLLPGIYIIKSDSKTSKFIKQ
jgi:hypothetical protein